jgi:transcriptional regulator of acetoin/glycerol metabolism
MQAAIASEGSVVRKSDVAAALQTRAAPRRNLTPHQALDYLTATNGNTSAAARRAGLPRSTFRDLIRRAQAMGIHHGGTEARSVIK